MKRKAVVRLLAGTLCTATMAGRKIVEEEQVCH